MSNTKYNKNYLQAKVYDELRENVFCRRVCVHRVCIVRALHVYDKEK